MCPLLFVTVPSTPYCLIPSLLHLFAFPAWLSYNSVTDHGMSLEDTQVIHHLERQFLGWREATLLPLTSVWLSWLAPEMGQALSNAHLGPPKELSVPLHFPSII